MKTAEGKALHEWILFQFPASQGNLELPKLIEQVESAGMLEAADIVKTSSFAGTNYSLMRAKNLCIEAIITAANARSE